MTDPVYITASGLRAVRHADDSIGLFVVDADGNNTSLCSAVHLSADRSKVTCSRCLARLAKRDAKASKEVA